jgi:predicted SAM-dependent methyltransferase
VEKVFLNLGCGDTAPEGWVNCDSSWNAQLSKLPFAHYILKKMGIVSAANWPRNVRYLSLGGRFPWKDESIDCVYASHVFEHLNRVVAENFMRETRRILRKGGVLRIVVPDLYYHASKYISNFAENKSGAEEFLLTIHLRMPYEKNFIRRFYNVMMDYPSLHKQMYDAVTLSDVFRQHDFSDIRLSEYGASNYIDNIRDVEYRQGGGYEGSIYVEAVRKP